MSEPHHFRFFQRNSVPHVQYKIYANDAWGPSDGHPFLASLPDVRSKPRFAEVFQANTEEVVALRSFSALKNDNYTDTPDSMLQRMSSKCTKL
jgi:hypothetical protein